MNSMNRSTDKKPSFVLKEFQAQKDKSTNDATVTLRPEMYAKAKADDKEAKLKKDTIGIERMRKPTDGQGWSNMTTSND
jgi:hypothetical protein